jgi:hypothetical protein
VAGRRDAATVNASDLSDCIFVVANSPSLFIFQIAHFLSRCFYLRMAAFASSEDADDATRVSEAIIGIGHDGVPTSRPNRTSWLPALFRGGVAFGEVDLLKNASLVDGARHEIRNLAGPAVIEAVGLEEEIRKSQVVKGPRLLCTQAFFDQLSDEARGYVGDCIEEPSRKEKEIYWPMAYFET